MPGSSPNEAFREFVAPLERALSCLGPAKITTSHGGQHQPGKIHSWAINRAAGFSRRGYIFDAQMHYEIIRDDREEYGPWRVSTRGYRYQIGRIGQHDLARLHWHPTGASHYTEPHLHLAIDSDTDTATDILKRHLPTARATFEDAITWAAVLGMPMARDDWPEVLKQCQEKHLVHRSWH